MADSEANLRRWQRLFYALGAALAPVAPMLFLQGEITRWKVGLLADAAGPRSGIAIPARQIPDTELSTPYSQLFVLGESTVAGLGARDHEHGLAGQFALNLSNYLQRPVSWNVLGRNGVTARRTIDELLPQMPTARDTKFDYILLGIGGNDVMRLSSPVKWRSDMTELITLVRERQPDATIFISNCPMIILSPAIPEPSKSLLWRLSRMHDANIREFTARMPRVLYYPQPVGIRLEGFFADGIHPSEQGYAEWSAAMIDYFATRRDEW